MVAAAPALLMFAERTPWAWLAPFLGRFHPVVLHFPIALLLLASLLELGRATAPSLRGFPVSFVLFLGTTGAVAAMALGWLLMRADAVQGPLVHRHMQEGIALAILAVLTLFTCLLAEGRVGGKGGIWVHRGFLLATCVMVLLTAHDGGSITHGEDFLVEHAPWHKTAPRPAIQLPVNKPLGQWDIYMHVVAPILQTRCVACHDTRMAKGGLNLGTWADIQRGGKDGPALLPGDPDNSLIFQRINLPLDHMEHMPPRRKAQPTPDEMALIRKWIALGAPKSGTLAAVHLDSRLLSVVGQLPNLLRSGGPAAESADSRDVDPAVVAKLRAGLAPAVARLQAHYPGLITYESRQSADLCLDAVTLGKKFGDKDVTALAPLRDRIVWVDFSGTAVTDGSAREIGAMKNLRVLKLQNTSTTDSAVLAFATLTRLESLNLYNTSTTPQAMAGFAHMKAIRRIYLASTKIPADAPCPASLRGKLVFASAAASILVPGIATRQSR
jgi:uncharacterized membrane protein